MDTMQQQQDIKMNEQARQEIDSVDSGSVVIAVDHEETNCTTMGPKSHRERPRQPQPSSSVESDSLTATEVIELSTIDEITVDDEDENSCRTTATMVSSNLDSPPSLLGEEEQEQVARTSTKASRVRPKKPSAAAACLRTVSQHCQVVTHFTQKPNTSVKANPPIVLTWIKLEFDLILFCELMPAVYRAAELNVIVLFIVGDHHHVMCITNIICLSIASLSDNERLIFILVHYLLDDDWGSCSCAVNTLYTLIELRRARTYDNKLAFITILWFIVSSVAPLLATLGLNWLPSVAEFLFFYLIYIYSNPRIYKNIQITDLTISLPALLAELWNRGA